MRLRFLVAFAGVTALTAGCSSTKAPVLPSSSGQTAYALHYDTDLTAATRAIGDGATREKTLATGFAAHVDELRKPDWQQVEAIVDDSDEAGKSAGFADAEGEASAVKSFWDSEKGDITARVAGGASQSMKQAGCAADVSGPISFSLNDAITKQLQKKLRAKNEAFVILERYKGSLGPQNVAVLEKLADEVSEASYIVHAQLLRQQDTLKRLAAERNDVKKTLDRFIEDENAFQKESGRSEADKKASQDRVTAATKQKAALDDLGQQAETASKDADKTIDAAKKDYEDALKALKNKIDEKKKNEPASDKDRRPPPAAPAAPAAKPGPKPEKPPPADSNELNP
jgi:hypothetical protein